MVMWSSGLSPNILTFLYLSKVKSQEETLKICDFQEKDLKNKNHKINLDFYVHWNLFF